MKTMMEKRMEHARPDAAYSPCPYLLGCKNCNAFACPDRLTPKASLVDRMADGYRKAA
jgi:hypothetical protein